ncbi:hypothetical protein M8A51_20405 [Schlegelella sp. S2-27]|uniref:Uncharacterized protein n=1 Tax=Caldimonas mangrovi TaxID=2944811 RepID=A0ABT0YT27_9BURK|nr:hypothetical protein [Caldimonas mangrovi]MCM5681897.1 hypothetical protein [Caldimonas mangrovi]
MFRTLAAWWLALRDSIRPRRQTQSAAAPPASQQALWELLAQMKRQPETFDVPDVPELQALLATGPAARAALAALASSKEGDDKEALRATLMGALGPWMDARHEAQAYCEQRCQGACLSRAAGCHVARIQRWYEDLPEPG